jgi:L-ascorbate metabolism protein UlaG (beta-lactamase superfamily)
MSSKAAFGALVALFAAAVPAVVGQAPGSPRPYSFETTDPGCQTATLVSTGGRAPSNPRTLAIRWAGYANFELAYNGQVVLLDTAFDRGSVFPPLGFKVPDITRVDAILIGHGHADHMSDAAAVAIRTQALVVGAPLTAQKLLSQSVPANRVRSVTGRGGEMVDLRAMRIEPVLGRHSVRDTSVTEPFEQVLRTVTPPLTDAQKAEQALISQRGVNDSRVTTEGTITYLITLDSGFRVLFRDSAGDITDFERAAVQRVGRIDLAIVAMANAYLNTLQAQTAMEYVRAYNPGIFMPAHHDAPYNDLWRTTEPVFQAMKDGNPNLITVSRGYREPVCLNTGTAVGTTR